MLESMMICLTPEETDAFIDIWQQHSCLWQVHDPGYKSKTARAHAMQDIADTFARGWTIGQYNIVALSIPRSNILCLPNGERETKNIT